VQQNPAGGNSFKSGFPLRLPHEQDSRCSRRNEDRPPALLLRSITEVRVASAELIKARVI